MRKRIGNHIFSDPKVGGGELRFNDTRIPVKDALELIEDGMTPQEVSAAYNHLISPEAVVESIRLANQALQKLYDSVGRKYRRAGTRKTATA